MSYKDPDTSQEAAEPDIIEGEVVLPVSDMELEEQPLNGMEQANEQPDSPMDDFIPHQANEENVAHPDDTPPQGEENVLPMEVMEPNGDDGSLGVENDTLRRSNRTPKYSARYKEFRRSMGLTTLIGNSILK